MSENVDATVNTENSSDWEDADVDSTDTKVEPLSQHIVSGTTICASAKSLITTMLHQNGRARSLRTALPKATSGDQPHQDLDGLKMRKDCDIPRSKPRPIDNTSKINDQHSIVANELSVSLREQLIWEQRRKLQSTTALRRRHSDADALKQQAENFHAGTEKEDSGIEFLDQGPAGYHFQGW